MKQTVNTTDKEGLHTQGEWKFFVNANEFYPFKIMSGETEIARICDQRSNESVAGIEISIANAELIVKAVNLYNKLPRLLPNADVPMPNDEYIIKAVNERQKLLETLEEIERYAEKINRFTYNTYQRQILLAINNAKNIQ